jgi:hypothetical protein
MRRLLREMSVDVIACVNAHSSRATRLMPRASVLIESEPKLWILD